jgi:hypothetical protein
MLDINENNPLNFFDALGSDTKMFVLGIGAAFAAIGIIWAILTLFKIVFANQNANSNKNEAGSESTFVPAPVYTQDTEIVAVISAAIAMAESETGNGIKFKVVSFKRK